MPTPTLLAAMQASGGDPDEQYNSIADEEGDNDLEGSPAMVEENAENEELMYLKEIEKERRESDARELADAGMRISSGQIAGSL